MDDWRQDVSTVCFCMISRLACGAHQLFIWRLRKYPYALMSSLNGGAEAAKVFNQRWCLKDELTQALCEAFPSDLEFSSEDCLEVIQALAILAETDIGAIERQHTIGRKIILSRSMTRPVALRTLSADFLLRQSCQCNTDSFSYLYFDSDSIIKKLQRRQRRNKKPKKRQKARRGGGGSFRAFLSETTRGTKASKYSWKRAAREYRNLSPEQKAYYKELGALGTESHKRGYHSFGKPVRPEPQRSGGMASLLSIGSASSGHHDSLGSSPLPDQLSLFDPKLKVKELLSKIHTAGSAVRKQAVESREKDLETVSSFLDGGSVSKPLSNVPHLPECRFSSECGATSYLPKPSSVPWMEWVPPADQFAQARATESRSQTLEVVLGPQADLQAFRLPSTRPRMQSHLVTSWARGAQITAFQVMMKQTKVTLGGEVQLWHLMRLQLWGLRTRLRLRLQLWEGMEFLSMTRLSMIMRLALISLHLQRLMLQFRRRRCSCR